MTAENIDPAATYRVALKHAVRLGVIHLKPMGEVQLRGKLLQRLIDQEGADVVVSAVRI